MPADIANCHEDSDFPLLMLPLPQSSPGEGIRCSSKAPAAAADASQAAPAAAPAGGACTAICEEKTPSTSGVALGSEGTLPSKEVSAADYAGQNLQQGASMAAKSPLYGCASAACTVAAAVNPVQEGPGSCSAAQEVPCGPDSGPNERKEPDRGCCPDSNSTAHKGPQSEDSSASGQRLALLVPCRTALRGIFPLSGTYFQPNEVFIDHRSLTNPLQVVFLHHLTVPSTV